MARHRRIHRLLGNRSIGNAGYRLPKRKRSSTDSCKIIDHRSARSNMRLSRTENTLFEHCASSCRDLLFAGKYGGALDICENGDVESLPFGEHRATKLCFASCLSIGNCLERKHYFGENMATVIYCSLKIVEVLFETRMPVFVVS